MRLFEEENGDGWVTFQIYDYTTSDLNLAMAVVKAVQIKTELTELDFEMEMFMLNHFKEKITALRKTNTKFIFVYDLTNFPFILARIDLNGPAPVCSNDASDTFGNDVMRLYINYNTNRVIMIVVNIHGPFTGVKNPKF